MWRVTYYHIKPGQTEALWKDFRENLKPVYEEAKKQGLLSGYKVWNNVTTDRPDDWDVAVATLYPNFAAIDQIDAKAATISAKHYGSREAMLEAGKKRSEIRERRPLGISGHLWGSPTGSGGALLVDGAKSRRTASRTAGGDRNL